MTRPNDKQVFSQDKWMKTPFHIEIPKRNSHCCKQGEKFLPGMEYFSVLLEDDLKKVKRFDYCSACWNSPEEKRVVGSGHWKSRLESKNIPPPTSRAEKALHLLKKLLESEDPPENEIFVLVLLLCHMRRLALRKEFNENSIRYGLYENVCTEEFIKIKLVDVSSLEIEKTQLSIASKLNSPIIEHGK